MAGVVLATVEWGDVATWVTGIATILLFVATFGLFLVGYRQIATERQARAKREMEEAQRRRLAQPERVSAWLEQEWPDMPGGGGVAWVAIANQSPAPVYQAVVSLFPVRFGIVHRTEDGWGGQGNAAGRVCVSVVPPGVCYVGVRVGSYHGMFREPGIEIAFTDAAGIHWVRTPFGELVEIAMPPVSHYAIDLPTNSEPIYRELPSYEPPEDMTTEGQGTGPE